MPFLRMRNPAMPTVLVNVVRFGTDDPKRIMREPNIRLFLWTRSHVMSIHTNAFECRTGKVRGRMLVGSVIAADGVRTNIPPSRTVRTKNNLVAPYGIAALVQELLVGCVDIIRDPDTVVPALHIGKEAVGVAENEAGEVEERSMGGSTRVRVAVWVYRRHLSPVRSLDLLLADLVHLCDLLSYSQRSE